jgi:hypothetical protein
MLPNLIQIQIASALSEDGVGDIRWVLLDPSEAAPEQEASVPAQEGGSLPLAAQVTMPSMPSMADHAAASTESTRETASSSDAQDGHQAAWTYEVLRALVLVAALTAAWWTAVSLLDQRSAPISGPQVSNRSTP